MINGKTEPEEVGQATSSGSSTPDVECRLQFFHPFSFHSLQLFRFPYPFYSLTIGSESGNIQPNLDFFFDPRECSNRCCSWPRGICRTGPGCAEDELGRTALARCPTRASALGSAQVSDGSSQVSYIPSPRVVPPAWWPGSTSCAARPLRNHRSGR